jgi:putative integral membrane protein (TIGR02587 family)
VQAARKGSQVELGTQQPVAVGEQTARSVWAKELDDQLRAVAGAFLFGAPLIYTQEVWLQGALAEPPHMLLALALTYAALVVLARTVGFRRRDDHTWGRALGDSAEALTIGLLVAGLSLLLLRRIDVSMSLDTVLGYIVLEAVACSIGVGIANGLLQQSATEQDAHGHATGASEHNAFWSATARDAGATVLGATVIALAIAPTDEIPLIAAALTPPWLLALMAISLLVSYIIVFEAEFVAQTTRRQQRGPLQGPLGETVFSYLLALITAALLLWFFGVLTPTAPWTQWLSYMIVLGLPATIGGAAGRLAV